MLDSIRINKEYILTISLYAIVISCFDVPLYINDIFSLGLPRLSGSFPYLTPFCAVILLLLIRIAKDKNMSDKLFDTRDILFFLGLLIWITLEYFHSIKAGEIRIELITTNLWFFFFYYLLKTYDHLFDIKQKLILAVIGTATAVGIFHWLMHIFALHSISPFADMINQSELLSRNSISFFSLFGIYLMIFYSHIINWQNRAFLYCGCFALNFYMLFLNNSRGAQMILLALIVMRVFLFKSLKTKTAVALLLGAGLVILAPFVDANKASSYFTGIDLDPVLGKEELKGLEDDVFSIYVRNKANILGMKSFFDSPLLGTGHAETFKVRVAGYIIHTYYVNLLVSYGLIGAVPYAIFLGSLLRKETHHISIESIVSLLFILGVMTFVNDMLAWYSIVFFISGSTMSPSLREI